MFELNYKLVWFMRQQNIQKYLYRSAKNLFEVLYMSQNDLRFGEWLNCFELIFRNYSSNLIYEEYFTIRKGTKKV